MAGGMVSASTGVMNSVTGKLTTLLGDEYKHIKGVKGGISFLRDESSSMNAVLQKLADMEDDQIDVQTKEWRNKVRELSYDIEDCIDRFIDRLSRGDAKANFISKAVRKMKMLWEDHQIGNEIKELKARVVDENQRRSRYNIDQSISAPKSVPLDPRLPTLYDEAKNLVGIDGPREEIIGWLKSEGKQLKVISIFGIGGLGKTTLAMKVYHKIEESFDYRALVTVSRNPDIKKLLRDILFQINRSDYNISEKWEMEQLVPMLRKNLKDNRYFIVIDDIWSIQAWNHLKCALPNNENRSRIITTTRNKDMAKSCCTGFGGHNMYELKPLSKDDSHSLFFRRVFSSSEDCPLELTEVTNEILRKCDGLPLAIISIASLLANKSPTVEVWEKIRNSVSSAVEKDSPVDQMKRILFLSYFDLPHHLKSCLLYLSVFPEDYPIASRELIWTWIAEGLIPGRNRESMEQLGESYLNELINRSMIQPRKIGVDGKTVKSCRVHDIMLDFIISQAVEDNFVTILNGKDFYGNFSNKIRRLTLQGKLSEVPELTKALKNSSHLRSVHMFGYDLPEQCMPQFLNSHVLRVLRIDDSGNFKNSHFEHIGIFCQLKYMRINVTDISELPEQIGKLQHLEILDVRGCFRISKLPTSIVHLHKLVHLFVEVSVALPDGIGSLQALEELSCIDMGKASIKAIQGLGELNRLRGLGILCCFWNEGYAKACASSLQKLVTRSLRSLDVRGMGITDAIYSSIFSCGSSPPLRRLVCGSPTGLSPIGSLVNLTRLRIWGVHEVGEEGFKILAGLPMLLSLTLGLCYVDQMQVIGSQGFRRLVKFYFSGVENGTGLMFEPGAMPKLQRLKLSLEARCQLKNGGLVFGLHHLSGLRHITAVISCRDAVADEVKALEGDIRGAAGIHPNHPILEMKTIYQVRMKRARE